jgi:hypothetical protein
MHASDIVHGDPHQENLMITKSGKMVWIDLERTQKRKKEWNVVTWNTLKLMDINTFLKQLIGSFFSLSFRDQNFRIFIDKCKAAAYKPGLIFLPHVAYAYENMVYDNNSCMALHSLFPNYIDLNFLKDPDMSSNPILMDLIDPRKLLSFISKCLHLSKDVPSDSIKFDKDAYNAYPITAPLKVSEFKRKNVAVPETRSSYASTVMALKHSDIPVTKDENESQKIQADQSYPLILNGLQMYTQKKNKLYYFTHAKQIYVKAYDESIGEYTTRDDVLKQLYYMSGERLVSYVYQSGYAFYYVENNTLLVSIVSNGVKKATLFYNLQYIVPKLFKTENHSQFTIPLSLNGDQYYSRQGNELKIQYDGSKFILCEQSDQHLVQLQPGKYKVYIYESQQLQPIKEQIKGFLVLNRNAYRYIMLSRDGTLSIWAKNDSYEDMLLKYNVVNKTIRLSN